MNYVLLCNKKKRKEYEPIIRKTDNIKLLGVETVLKPNFVQKIIDDYSPHGLIIVHGVTEVGKIDVLSAVSQLKAKRPNLRVIYDYGEITDEKDFFTVYGNLVPLKIFDIVTKQNFGDIFPELVNAPFTREQLDESIKPDETEEPLTETVKEPEKPVFEALQGIAVKLDWEAFKADGFDLLRIVKETETDEDKFSVDNIIICFAALQHHVGCTHLSFEMGAFLRRKRKNACVIISDGVTYDNLCNFYDVPENYRDDGFLIKELNVFPFSKYEEVKQTFNCIICDLGFGFQRDGKKEIFDGAAVKIMLCSAGEWDISETMRFINNSPDLPVRDINYCFFPISQPRFVGFNRQMIKAGCRAYRIRTSEGCLQPCNGNTDVYLDILRQYTDIVPAAKRKSIRRAMKF